MNTEYMNLPQLLVNDSGAVILATKLSVARNSVEGKVLISDESFKRGQEIILETTGFALFRGEVVLEDGTLLKNTLKWNVV